MRLALLSNVTVDLLADKLKNYDVYIPAGFDAWQQEVLNTSSGLYSFQPEAVVVLLHAEEIRDKRVVDEWCSTVKVLCKNMSSIPIFVSSLDIDIKCRYGAENNQHLETYFTEKLQSLHDKEGLNVYALPVKDCITNLGRNNFYSPKMWYFGSMPYSMKGLAALSSLITKYAEAAKSKRKKCLAVDLDNTIWGGVIGEEGVEGITLSNHKEGAVYKDTQRLLKKMKNQGVMLAIISKNNVDDVEPVFSHPDMLLHHEDFVAEIINWEAKPKNIKKLAADLNIGLDSIVFLDDNPAEREQMKAECPEVAVIDFPMDTALLPTAVAKAYDDFFFSLEVTDEDLKKTSMYKAEEKRKIEQSEATSLDDYLKNLKMKLDIHRMLPEEKKRVVQLINKTNQFNTTTKRYSEDDVMSLLKAGSDIFTVHVADKYGEQGLVTVLILNYKEKSCIIDTFLMSCRVMGRNIEFEIMSKLKEYLKQKGISSVKASYIRTNRNTPVSNLFDKLGFMLIKNTETEKGYVIDVNALPNSTNLFDNFFDNSFDNSFD